MQGQRCTHQRKDGQYLQVTDEQSLFAICCWTITYLWIIITNLQISQSNSDVSWRVDMTSETLQVFHRFVPLKKIVLRHPSRPYITDTIKEIIKL